MFAPWITVPAKDIYVEFPLGIFDGDTRIMFRNVEVIDSAIEQLQKLKEIMKSGEQ